MSFNALDFDVPIGSGRRTDTSGLFSFSFGKKSGKSSNSKSSTAPAARDSGRSHHASTSSRRRSTSTIAPTPIVKRVSKKGRKLSSTSSPTFNSNRDSSDTDSPPVIRQADEKSSRTKKRKFEQRQKEQTVKEKRKSTEVAGSRNGHVQVATSSSSLGKDGATPVISEALRAIRPNPVVRLERLQLPQPEPKSEVPEAVDTHADLNESESSPPANDSNLTEQDTINISNNIILEPDESMDESDDTGESVISFNVVENVESYRTLCNSEKTDNHITVGESLTKSFASFVSPEFGSRHQEFPGVTYSLINASDSLKVGYMRIAAKTLRPFDCMENVQVLYWILSGTVTIRSTGGFYSKGEEQNKSNFLFGKSLSTGSCIMIPPNTCFTVENWEEDEALIGYSTLIGDL